MRIRNNPSLLLIGLFLLLLLSCSCLTSADAKQFQAMEEAQKNKLNEDGKPYVIARHYPEDGGSKNHHFIPREAFNNYGGSDNGGG